MQFLDVSSLKQRFFQKYKFLSFINIYISFVLSLHQSVKNSSPLSFSGLFPSFDSKTNALCWNVNAARAPCSKKMMLFRNLLKFSMQVKECIDQHTQGDETPSWEQRVTGNIQFLNFYGEQGTICYKKFHFIQCKLTWQQAEQQYLAVVTTEEELGIYMILPFFQKTGRCSWMFILLIYVWKIRTDEILG